MSQPELRSWAPPASLLDGGTLLIHAAKAAPVWGSHRRRRLILGRLGCDEAALPLGAVVATCKVESALAVERAPRRPGGPCRVRDLRTVVRSAPVDRRAAPIRPTRNAGRQTIGRQSAGNRQAIGR